MEKISPDYNRSIQERATGNELNHGWLHLDGGSRRRDVIEEVEYWIDDP